MIYGIPTLMEFSDIEVLARFAADNGFRFVEMNMTFPWFQPDAVNAETIRRLMRAYGVGFTIHLHDQVNPFEFSPEMRRGHLENVLCALDWACELALPRINMHLLPGTYSSVNGVKTYLYAHCLDRYLSYVRAFRELADQRLKGKNTVFCIENTSGWQSFHHDAIEELLKSACFGLTFDVGHDYRSGGRDEAFILSHRDRLCHFHIHDCDGNANHLALGEGRMDLPRYFRLAESLDATVVTEVKESGALIRSKEYLIGQGMW